MYWTYHWSFIVITVDDSEHPDTNDDEHVECALTVASFDWDNVQNPMIICVFLFLSGIIKIGESLYRLLNYVISDMSHLLAGENAEVVVAEKKRQLQRCLVATY